MFHALMGSSTAGQHAESHPPAVVELHNWANSLTVLETVLPRDWQTESADRASLDELLERVNCKEATQTFARAVMHIKYALVAVSMHVFRQHKHHSHLNINVLLHACAFPLPGCMSHECLSWIQHMLHVQGGPLAPVNTSVGHKRAL